MKKYNTINVASMFGFMDVAELIKLVQSSKRDEALFLVPMLPIHDLGLAVYTSTSDEAVLVPCVVVEEKHALRYNYKIEVKSLEPGFGRESFYLSDFTTMLRQGHAHIIDQASPLAEEPKGFAGFLHRIVSMIENLRFGTQRETASKATT